MRREAALDREVGELVRGQRWRSPGPCFGLSELLTRAVEVPEAWREPALLDRGSAARRFGLSERGLPPQASAASGRGLSTN
jgi:hypothetical protein